MDSSSSNRSDQWNPGHDAGDQGASNDSTWGEGSASALESLKKREQRRDHGTPRRDPDEHPDGT